LTGWKVIKTAVFEENRLQSALKFAAAAHLLNNSANTLNRAQNNGFVLTAKLLNRNR
jgi:hypothetical protein